MTHNYDIYNCRYEAEGRKKPKIVPALEDLDVISVECGGMHTAALTKDGKVYHVRSDPYYCARDVVCIDVIWVLFGYRSILGV